MGPVRIQDGRPSLRLGTPRGSEDCFSRVPVANHLSYVVSNINHGWQEDKRRSDNEGIRLKTHRLERRV